MSGKNIKIFFSWQSDKNKNNHKKIVTEAIINLQKKLNIIFEYKYYPT
jgi:hypothetical protein